MRCFLFQFIVGLIFLNLMRCPLVFAAESQPRWIIFGSPQDSAESRIFLGGALQPFPDGFMISPLIETHAKWLSGAQADREVYYKEGYLPIPTVVWNFQDLRLEIEAFAWGPPERGLAWVRYRLINKTSRDLEGKIHFLLRPDSKKSVNAIEFSEEGQSVLVNGTQSILLSEEPESAGFLKHGTKSLIRKIKRRELLQIHSVKDPEGRASGAWSYSFKLGAAKSALWGMLIPLHPDGSNLEAIHFRETFLAARTFWRKKLSQFEIQIADSELEDTVRFQMASLFVHRDHPGFYPDDFKTGEAWTGNTLKAVQTYLDYGFLEEAREDLEIMALRMDVSGEVQARMKKNETENSVKEYKLQGEFISAVWNYYRGTRDKTWLAAKWPLIKNILEYSKKLRSQRLTEWYASQRPEVKGFYGILPPSMDPLRGDFESLHRYEDDLMGIKAFKAGQEIAEELNFPEELKGMKNEEQLLRRAMLASVEITASHGNVRFIPAMTETTTMLPWPGSTAVWPSEEAAYFPVERMNYHFRNIKYLFEKTKKTDSVKAAIFSDFSVVRALLRRGDKETAHAMFRFQQTRLDAGNVSNTAGFLQAFRDFFVYEFGEKLILGAGIFPLWTEGAKGLRVNLPTSFGEIKYSILPAKKGWHVHVEGKAMPPEGFVFHAPSGSGRKVFRHLPFDFELSRD